MHYIQIFSLRVTRNTVCFHYTEQVSNAAYRNSGFVLWESCGTYGYVVWKNVEFFVLYEVTSETVYVPRRVRVTTVAMEKQLRNEYYILWLCVCSLTYSVYCHLLPLRLYNIYPLTHDAANSHLSQFCDRVYKRTCFV